MDLYDTVNSMNIIYYVSKMTRTDISYSQTETQISILILLFGLAPHYAMYGSVNENALVACVRLIYGNKLINIFNFKGHPFATAFYHRSINPVEFRFHSGLFYCTKLQSVNYLAPKSKSVFANNRPTIGMTVTKFGHMSDLHIFMKSSTNLVSFLSSICSNLGDLYNTRFCT